MDGSDLVIVVPMLGRPHHVARLLESTTATVPGARVLFCCSPGDSEVVAAVEASTGDLLVVSRETGHGDYARKINTGYRCTTEPLIFLGASDIVFRAGWFQAATARLGRPGVGVVGTNDLGSARVRAGVHATHSLVTRSYADTHGTIDGPGEILHEGYHHFCCDDELVATAHHRGAWAMALDSVVEHLHPYFGGAETDATYVLGASQSRQDRRKLDARRHLWPAPAPLEAPVRYRYRNRTQPDQIVGSPTRIPRLDRLPNWELIEEPPVATTHGSAATPRDATTTIVVATFGGPEWVTLARERAIPSAQAQGRPVIHAHSDSLHGARNQGLAQVTTPRVIFLDADDELAPGYADAMDTGTADVRAPAVSYISGGRVGAPYVPRVPSHRHECTGACLTSGGWLTIGASAPVELLRSIGGFGDWPIYEDYDLWLRCHLAGATFEAIPAAVYRAHVREGSRNRSLPHPLRVKIHYAILAAAGV